MKNIIKLTADIPVLPKHTNKIPITTKVIVSSLSNTRVQDNPANQNEDLYEVFGVRKGKHSWDRECDFFINRTSYRPNIKYFSTKKSSWTEQLGIVIKKEFCRAVFSNMNMTPYILRNIASYTINPEQIHQAYNAAVLK